MNDTYVAYFARQNGRIFHAVGQEPFELYDGEPLNEVTWYGERWIRISDLRNGAVHYIPATSLA